MPALKTWTREVALLIFGLWTFETFRLLHWAKPDEAQLTVYASLTGLTMIAVPFLLGVKAAQQVADRHSKRSNPRLTGEDEVEGAG